MKKILICLMLLFCICGCKNKNNLVGTWKYNDGVYTYVFNDDLTGYYMVGNVQMPFTYTFTNDSFTIYYTGTDANLTSNYEIKNNELIIKNANNSVKYIKE